MPGNIPGPYLVIYLDRTWKYTCTISGTISELYLAIFLNYIRRHSWTVSSDIPGLYLAIYLERIQQKTRLLKSSAFFYAAGKKFEIPLLHCRNPCLQLANPNTLYLFLVFAEYMPILLPILQRKHSIVNMSGTVSLNPENFVENCTAHSTLPHFFLIGTYPYRHL